MLNFARDNYIFPETRGNKNKQWTHITPLMFINRDFQRCLSTIHTISLTKNKNGERM